MISVAIVDDHPIFREGLAAAVQAIEHFDLFAVTESVEELIPLLSSVIDVIVLDYGLAGLSGAEAVSYLCGLGYSVLVFSASSSRADIVAAIGAGASGYLSKSAPPAEIEQAVESVSRGGTYVSPTLASFLLSAYQAGESAPEFELTKREGEILSLLASGERDADIAEQLFISVSTVGSHLDRIRDKTGRRRRAELTRLAVEQGLIDPEP